jgi:GLPGLI family protein
MKTFISSLIIFVLFNTSTAFSQFANFTKQGFVEYEKTINMYAVLKPTNSENTFQQMFYDKYKSTQPQFSKLRSKLTFHNNKSLFIPIWEDNDKVKSGWGSADVTQINEVFTDLNTSSFTTLKKVFEDNFIVKDSLRKINWKITTEMRQIAGYNCRRANAIIMDSIYVVAFYTDEIPFSGGPESFTGLPGMILGVVLPQEHVNWFATKVGNVNVTEEEIKAPSNGKPINLKGLREKILSVGEYFEKSLKTFLL